MLGYNATCFAYGQTGAGKTYTMYGPNGNTDDAEQRGLTPRVLDHLFARMAREERVSDGTLKYNCSGSFLQIYNERIIDLLEGYHADGAAAPSSSSSSAGAHALTRRRRSSCARTRGAASTWRTSRRSTCAARRTRCASSRTASASAPSAPPR